MGGSSHPAVRAEVNPLLLSKLGVGLDQVRTALGGRERHIAKGPARRREHTMSSSDDNDQLFLASQYAPLIVAYHNGAPVRLSDVATVVDILGGHPQRGNREWQADGPDHSFPPAGREHHRNGGPRPGDDAAAAGLDSAVHSYWTSAETARRRFALRFTTWRSAWLISVVLVILVVFVFLRNVWATAIPSVAVPLSLVGTFGVMYLLGYTIDNLSLMALTISTGFVVDDAIVVIENITRYLEQGIPPMEAALRGSEEIGFTVLSMSTSLVAVFIPILLMGGIVGRLFREFAVTLASRWRFRWWFH